MFAVLVLALSAPFSPPDFSSCVSSLNTPQHACDFQIEAGWENDKYVLFLSEKVGMDGNAAKWKLVFTQSLTVPQVTTSHIVGGAGTLCQYQGKNDEHVVALASFRDDQQWSTSVSYAWKINVSAKMITEISPQNVRCENEGWGL